MSINLNQWCVIFRPGLHEVPYLAPEQRKQCLGGIRERDGKPILTSPIKGRRKEMVVTDSGSEYVLKEVDPKYEAAYPNALQKLMQSLPEV